MSIFRSMTSCLFPSIICRLSSVVRCLSSALRHLSYVLRRPLLLGIPILIFALALIGLAGSNDPSITDTDGDRPADAYEAYARFFGLNPTNPADACLDYDDDHLSNLQESELLTDPFAPDTDYDKFNDNVDASPISRAYIQWGAPQFTTGDQYDYAHPDWFLAAYKNGGEWMVDITTTQSAWQVASTEPPDVESLSIDLDRAMLTNNLRYAVHYLNTSNSSLYVDLLDTNGAVLVENLCGNLMTGSNVACSNSASEVVVLLEIPTAKIPDAAVIHLRRGEPACQAAASERGLVESTFELGDIIVYEGLVYIDEDGDGLDNEQERQLGTSDYCVDTDGDGVSDYEACFHTTNTNSPVPTEPDVDDDGDEDKDKVGIIYVDQARGNDTFTGRAPLPTSPKVGSGKKGPKKTIHKGMSAVDADGAHTLVIKSGTYNENLDIRGKNVKVVIEGNVRL